MVVEPPPITIDAFEIEGKAVRREFSGRDADGFERAIAETDVPEIKTVLGLDAQHEMIADHGLADKLAHHGARRARDVESQLLRRPAEDAVHLVAPAAALAHHDFLVDGRDIDGDFVAELDIEVLVRNRKQMRAMERAQRFQIGTGWAAHADTVEIAINVHLT